MVFQSNKVAKAPLWVFHTQQITTNTLELYPYVTRESKNDSLKQRLEKKIYDSKSFNKN